MKNRYRLTKLGGFYKNKINYHVIANQNYFAENDEIALRGWVKFNDESTKGFKPKIEARVGKKKIQLPITFEVNDKVNLKFNLPVKTESGFKVRFKIKDLIEQLGSKTEHYSIDFILSKDENTLTKVFSLALSIDNYIKPLVFITGSPRSGTSVSGNAIRDALNAPGFGENHVSNILSNTLQELEKTYLNSGSSLSNKSLVGVVNGAVLKASVINSFKALYNNFLTGDYLVDKTPGIPAISSLTSVLEAWPETKIIFCKRRGIENVASRLNKFPGISFDQHCKQWAKTFEVWKKIKRNLVEGENYIEIDQFDIQEKPAKVALDLSLFLVKSDELQNQIEKSFKNKRPQKTQEISKPNSLDNINWTLEQKELFLNHCLDANKEQGYSIDESYFL